MDVVPDAVEALASAASDVNARICEIAQSLAGRGDESHEYMFLCECGCLRPVTLTITAFLANGALLEGHETVNPRIGDTAGHGR